MATQPERRRKVLGAIGVVSALLVVLLIAIPVIATFGPSWLKDINGASQSLPAPTWSSTDDTEDDPVPPLLASDTGSADNDEATTEAESCKVKYYAAAKKKEVPYAIGTRVTARSENAVTKELKERRTCGENEKFDPQLTATQYAEWSSHGLTEIKVGFGKIDSFRERIRKDPELYASVVKELEELEGESSFKIQKVSAGLWSVYVKIHSDGKLTTHIGTSANKGDAAVYTHPSGAVIKYRLQCGFQILHEHDSPPPGIDKCKYDDCEPSTPPLESKNPRNDVAPPQGTTPRGPGDLQDKPKPKPKPLNPTTPVTADPGGGDDDDTPSGTHNPDPDDPGTPITDPDG